MATDGVAATERCSFDFRREGSLAGCRRGRLSVTFVATNASCYCPGVGFDFAINFPVLNCQLLQLLDAQSLGFRNRRYSGHSVLHLFDPLSQQARIAVKAVRLSGFEQCLPATVDIILEVIAKDGALDLTACLPTAVEQVGVHDEVVVRLQGRPEIVLAEPSVCGAALQTARAMTVPTAP